MEILLSENYDQVDRLKKVLSSFEERFGLQPEIVVRVPGR